METSYSERAYLADKALVGRVERLYRPDMSVRQRLEFIRDVIGYKALRGGVPGKTCAKSTSIDLLLADLPRNEHAMGRKAAHVIESVYACAQARIDRFEQEALNAFDQESREEQLTHAAATHPDD